MTTATAEGAAAVDVTAGVPLVEVLRDGAVESLHHGHVAVCDADGRLIAGLGAPDASIYPRSALKPFQAAAVLDVVRAAGGDLDDASLAIASASHVGTDEHQVEAARLLALAGLDEDALRCPAALPLDEPAAARAGGPHRLSHNCSGKHAAFLLAQATLGDRPADYLEPNTTLQRTVRARLAALADAEPEGPGVDGCGAPAWRLPLSALATAFARAAAATPATDGGLARVGSAMRARPDLVGGQGTVDCQLMRASGRVVAKRGAEGVLGVGVADGAGGGWGVAVKIADGAARGTGPAVCAALTPLGVAVPDAVAAPPVLGGGAVHGRIAATAPARAALAGLLTD